MSEREFYALPVPKRVTRSREVSKEERHKRAREFFSLGEVGLQGKLAPATKKYAWTRKDFSRDVTDISNKVRALYTKLSERFDFALRADDEFVSIIDELEDIAEDLVKTKK